MQTRGEGVKKSENVADVIYGSPLIQRALNPFIGGEERREEELHFVP